MGVFHEPRETVAHSSSHDIFLSNWTDFKNKYQKQKLQGWLLSFVEKTWMPNQVHSVRCFADEQIHLGMRVTSRAKLSHAVFKKYINLAKCDLLTLQQRLNLMLEAQVTRVEGNY
jgi:hypothetical protein